MDSKLEALWRTYEEINAWIKFADAKAATILGINGILAGFAITKN